MVRIIDGIGLANEPDTRSGAFSAPRLEVDAETCACLAIPPLCHCSTTLPAPLAATLGNACPTRGPTPGESLRHLDRSRISLDHVHVHLVLHECSSSWRVFRFRRHRWSSEWIALSTMLSCGVMRGPSGHLNVNAGHRPAFKC